MKAYWLSISTQFAARTARERYFLAGGILVLLYAISNLLLLSPLVERNKLLHAELAADQMQMQTIRQQIAVYSQQNTADPDKENKHRLTELLSRLQLQDTQLKELQAALVQADDIPNLLSRLLQRNSQLKLIALKTLPAQGLFDDEIAKPDSSKPTVAPPSDQANSMPSGDDDPVYKHEVEITVEGRYLDLLDYVAELENMPWHVLWSSAVLQVNENDTSRQPLSQLKLTIYTLSLDHTWLSI